MPLETDPRPTVLLTGFGPFPGVCKNISGSLARLLAFKARTAARRFRFVSAVLPTEWTRAPSILAELYDRHDPVVALHFGVASNMRGFRIETQARNFCSMSPDAAGKLPTLTRVSANGAQTLAATIDANSMARHLDASDHYATLSDDAGSYLCNTVLYHSLIEAGRRDGRCRVGFVHIAAASSRQDLIDRLVPAGLKVLEVALDALQPPRVLTSV